MPKLKYFLYLFMLASVTALAAESGRVRNLSYDHEWASNRYYADSLLSEYSRLTPKQLLDTARYHEAKGEFDIALTCFNVIINAPETDGGDEWQRYKIDALNNSAIIYYYWMSDHVKAYQLFVDALELCETYPYEEAEYKIYNNIANIYLYLDEYEMAGRYYANALEICADSVGIMLLHNNIADASLKMGRLDSAFVHIGKSLQISERHKSKQLSTILYTAASIYREKGLFDSAMHYYELALDDARLNGRVEYEVEILTGLGNLFLDTEQPEKAESYIEQSSDIAKANNLNNILLGNYLTLSNMKYSLGDYKKAMEYLERHNRLRDSLFSTDKLANISQLRRVGEISKANRNIERLTVEQQIKERTIGYQQIIMFIAFAVLLLVAAVLLFVWSQKRKLNKAYRVLFEKNIEIMELQGGPSRKAAKSMAHYDNDGELLERILAIMEDTEVICNPKFSINVLSSLVEANHIYVSQVINTTLHKNFRSFLNGYRVREAQRLFSESDAAKYTVESVSLQVGYKSMNTFRAAFQEITGVSPGFYLKSMRETPKE